MNNINIAELLKDCPKGTKLWSPLCGECEFVSIYDGGIYVRALRDRRPFKFMADGKYYDNDGVCVLFPSREQWDWGKFCPFKDGDVLRDNCSVFIFKSRMFDKGLNSYVYNSHCHFIPLVHLRVKPGGFNHITDNASFATEEEKQKLFQAIKDNGYKWNADTKALEKEEKKDKFDIATLMPFDKVLVRDNDKQKWVISFFSHCNGLEFYKYSCINGCGYAYCIPYEHNEHLLDTTNDCNDYYKTWKDETDE